jgi:hypothetical protein
MHVCLDPETMCCALGQQSQEYKMRFSAARELPRPRCPLRLRLSEGKHDPSHYTGTQPDIINPRADYERICSSELCQLDVVWH